MSRPKHIKETRFEYLCRTVRDILDRQIDECVEWPYGKVGGYGVLDWRPDPHQLRLHAVEKAHRLSYFIAYGEWPLPLGRHTCDNPICFNPRHIIPGTDAENGADKVLRGRAAHNKGEKNGSSKLTDELVIEMRRLALTFRIKEIAEKMGLHRKTVGRIVKGQHWSHIPGAQASSQHHAWLEREVVNIEDKSACIIWPFCVVANARPMLRVDGKKVAAHHYAYKLIHGEYPRPAGVRTCKDGMCINPYHVVAAFPRYRRPASPGESNPAAKLTWEIVRGIRSYECHGQSQQKIADKYGVTQSTVSAILLHKIWKEVVHPTEVECTTNTL